MTARVAGLLLAAGSGRRFGGPKALADTGDGPWVLRALATLAPCAARLVVVGEHGDHVAALLPVDATAVPNPDHRGGMASSLTRGLQALPESADAVLITLVDLPDVTVAVSERLLELADRTVLARAVYEGAPGHPVLIGADRIPELLAELGNGDVGAADFLRRRSVVAVECSDLATGADVDALPPSTQVFPPDSLPDPTLPAD